MNSSKLLIGLIVAVLLIAGGYYLYRSAVESPAPWLIKLFTKTDEPPPLPAGDIAPLNVPEGFVATVYARGIDGARVMTRDQNGTMLVSQTSSGKVVALPDTNGDGKSDETITVLENLKQPHGITVICSETGNPPCTLYVAETGALKAYQYDADTHTATFVKDLATFPTGRGHFTRTLLQHPDGRLLVSVGSSCNVCNEDNAMRATVQALDLATGAISTFASGLRNSVFLAVHPVTGEIWGTENGRDIIGDDIPPDEINIIREGQNYGWPVCYGKNVYDTDFDARDDKSCTGLTPSHIDLQAHSAALGLGFVPEEGWPESWHHDLIVAFHGSWNRSEPTGYKLVRINLDPQGAYQGIEDFITGFMPEGGDEDSAIGRPVGIMVQPGGTLYVSDDRAGAIYKISRTEIAM